jgi:hypothetical protein
VACIERCLDDFNAVIDLMIYLEARAILGLPPASWRRPRPPPAQRRRTRTFAELLARAEACALRLADIERLAQRRAEKLERLLSTRPDLPPRSGEALRAQLERQANSGGGLISRIATAAATAALVPRRTAHASRTVRAPRSGEEGLRVLAPP